MRPVSKTVSSLSISDPIRVNWRGGQSNFNLSLVVELNPGALTYSVEHTLDAPTDFADAADYNANAVWFDTPGVTGLSANGGIGIDFPVQALRLNVTAYTSGSAKITVLQSN